MWQKLRHSNWENLSRVNQVEYRANSNEIFRSPKTAAKQNYHICFLPAPAGKVVW